MTEEEMQKLVTMLSGVVDQKIDALRAEITDALEAYMQWTVETVKDIDNGDVLAEFQSHIDEFWQGAISAAYKGKRRKNESD